jgi:hypothetical protein
VARGRLPHLGVLSHILDSQAESLRFADDPP